MILVVIFVYVALWVFLPYVFFTSLLEEIRDEHGDIFYFGLLILLAIGSLGLSYYLGILKNGIFYWLVTSSIFMLLAIFYCGAGLALYRLIRDFIKYKVINKIIKKNKNRR